MVVDQSTAPKLSRTTARSSGRLLHPMSDTTITVQGPITAEIASSGQNHSARTEDGGGIFCIRNPDFHRGWNGIRYKTGLTASNVDAKKLSMNVATVPPGAVAYAHIHVDFEVMLFILRGKVRHEFGDNLEKSMDNEAGDFIFIKPGIPHEVINLSDSEPVIAVVARSDADEWENIVDVPSNRRPDK